MVVLNVVIVFPKRLNVFGRARALITASSPVKDAPRATSAGIANDPIGGIIGDIPELLDELLVAAAPGPRTPLLGASLSASNCFPVIRAAFSWNLRSLLTDFVRLSIASTFSSLTTT